MPVETELNEKKAKRARLGLRIFFLASATFMTAMLVHDFKAGYITAEAGSPFRVYRAEDPSVFWTVIVGYSAFNAFSLYMGLSRNFGQKTK